MIERAHWFRDRKPEVWLLSLCSLVCKQVERLAAYLVKPSLLFSFFLKLDSLSFLSAGLELGCQELILLSLVGFILSSITQQFIDFVECLLRFFFRVRCFLSNWKSLGFCNIRVFKNPIGNALMLSIWDPFVLLFIKQGHHRLFTDYFKLFVRLDGRSSLTLLLFRQMIYSSWSMQFSCLRGNICWRLRLFIFKAVVLLSSPWGSLIQSSFCLTLVVSNLLDCNDFIYLV